MKSLQRMTKAELLARVRELEQQAAPSSAMPPGSLEIEGTQQWLKAILETAVEGIITINRQGIIQSCNPAAEKIFGYTSRELIGRKVDLLMPPPYCDNHDRYLQNYQETGQAKIIGIGREVVGQRKDGTVFPMHLSVSEVRLPSSVFFTGFVRDITQEKALEREVLTAIDQEQRRIGRDLHDGLSQQLAAIEFMSRALEQRLAVAAPAEAKSASKIGDLLRQTIAQTRDLAKGLSPVLLDPDGLMDALQILAANVRSIYSIDCRLECHEKVMIHDNAMATHLFRIAQEAVNNALRHGRATKIRLGLSQSPARLVLAIEDNGRGMPPKLKRRQGMGLRIMQYRVGTMGGSLLLLKGTLGGTSVVCTIHRPPLHPSIQPSPDA